MSLKSRRNDQRDRPVTALGASDVYDLGEDDYGVDESQVDLFGLDEFGMPAGADALWGGVLGGGIGTATAIVLRRVSDKGTTLYNFSEAFGFLASGVAAGVMLAFPSSRRMGWAAIATAAITNGLRQVETMMFGKKDLAALVANGTAAEVSAEEGVTPAGFGAVAVESDVGVISPYEGLGQDIDIYDPNSFGAVDIESQELIPSQGGFGVAVAEPGYLVPGTLPRGGLGQSSYESEREQEDVAQTQLVGPPQLVGAGDYGLGNNPGVAQATALGGPAVSGLSTHFGATLFGSH